jgi:hypothetical protein
MEKLDHAELTRVPETISGTNYLDATFLLVAHSFARLHIRRSERLSPSIFCAVPSVNLSSLEMHVSWMTSQNGSTVATRVFEQPLSSAAALSRLASFNAALGDFFSLCIEIYDDLRRSLRLLVPTKRNYRRNDAKPERKHSANLLEIIVPVFENESFDHD